MKIIYLKNSFSFRLLGQPNYNGHAFSDCSKFFADTSYNIFIYMVPPHF